MVTPAPRWQRLEHDERRAQILECARRLFSERVYSAVSTGEIAASAGVARGLLHHYFGTKRDLYLEVVRLMVSVPSHPVLTAAAGRPLAEALDEAVENWLEAISRNRGTWLAAHGAQGLGRDPEVEAILDEARERTIDDLIAAFESSGAPRRDHDLLRAVLRAYSGLAEAASVEWLERDRLTRAQVHALVVQGFFSTVGDVLDAVVAARSETAHSAR
jgi:AcrR family transcriptional regulator